MNVYNLVGEVSQAAAITRCGVGSILGGPQRLAAGALLQRVEYVLQRGVGIVGAP